MDQKHLDELSSKCGLVLSLAEQEKMICDLTTILAFVDQIHTFPTEHVVPLTHPGESGTMRVVDEPESLKHQELHQSETTDIVENFYLVPKVI